MLTQLSTFVQANSEWLYPAAAGGAGWCGVKYWERARPLCFPESFDAGLPGHVELKVPDGFDELADKSPALSKDFSLEPTVRNAGEAFRLSMQAIREIKTGRTELERLAKSSESALTMTQQHRWIADVARQRVVPHFLVLGLIRDQLTLTIGEVNTSGPLVHSITKAQVSKDVFALCIKDGGAYVPLVYESPTLPNNFELARPFIAACQHGDVKCLSRFLSQGLHFLDEQVELHRQIAKLLQPLLAEQAIIGGEFVLVNRGTSTLLIAPEATLEFSTKDGAKLQVEGYVLTLASNGNGETGFVRLRGTGIVKGGEMLRARAVSAGPIKGQAGSEQILAAAKAGRAEVRLRLTRHGSFFRSIVSAKVPFGSPGQDDVLTMSIP